MAWTNPRNWTTGELVTAALLNEQWRDNINELRYGHIVVANATARNAIPNLAAGVMAYQTDVSGLYVYDGANWRLVPFQ